MLRARQSSSAPSYVFLGDLKLLDAVTVAVEQNTVAFDLGKFYPDIDLAETISCLTGKQIMQYEDALRAEWEERP